MSYLMSYLMSQNNKTLKLNIRRDLLYIVTPPITLDFICIFHKAHNQDEFVKISQIKKNFVQQEENE